MDLLVVGAGAMGRWLARALYEVTHELTFHDADPAAAAAAAEAVGGNATDAQTAEAVDTHKAVCIAVPIPAAASAIETFADHAETAIFDVTGTMADPLAAMGEHANGLERFSLHPLFAPANEPGNVPVVVDRGGPSSETVMDSLSARRNEVFETTAEEHDRAMETVQARAHTAVLAYALAAEPVDERFHTPISSELTALAAQVTEGESRVYADIQAAFDGAEDVAAAAADLAGADPEAFAQLYEDARR